VVDHDYRGEVGVVLFNHGTEDFNVEIGDRVAQLVLERISMAPCVQVEELSDTSRSGGGFGSTGVAPAAAHIGKEDEPALKRQQISTAMQVKLLTSTAVMPVRGSASAAGFDIAASEGTVVKARGQTIVKTGLSIAIPENTYARLAPRSGLAVKKSINVGAGVVDYDYRGEVRVVLCNHGDEDFTVSAGDRIAQLILERIVMAPCEEVSSLSATDRGEGGFGSTGVVESLSKAAKIDDAHTAAGLDADKAMEGGA